MADAPTVTILLLGDSDCGKSTFLSRLSRGRDAIATPTSRSTPLVGLRDLDQPFVYDIRMYNRPYRFEFYDTASPQSYTLLSPDMVVLCFDINDRDSLEHVQSKWRKEIYMYWHARDDRIPVMLLGLKRDLRTEGEDMIWPEESYRIAQEMRCDRYAECSAVTGELMRETFEDIARLAARTTTANGGMSAGPSCVSM